jgi:hypothetical protein
MNYTTPTNEDKKLERPQKEVNSAINDTTNKLNGGNSTFQTTSITSFADLPNESPISFDKSAILPLEKLEVNYEWISSVAEFNQNNIQLNASEDSENDNTKSDYLDESFTSKQSSLSDMKSKSNLFLGIILSLIGALGAAYLWGKTTMLIDEYIEQHHYAFMAILVGLFAALGMRIGGRGHRPIFGIIAVLTMILGCFVGNGLAAIEPLAQSFQLSYIETLRIFDVIHLWGFLKDRFEYVDILFYTIGVFLAYYLAFSKSKHLFKN